MNTANFYYEQWQKSFGVGHNLLLTAIRNRLDKLAKRYNKEVYIQCHLSKNKHKKNCTCAACTDSSHSQRRIIQKWKQENNSLFDIGIDMDTLEGD